MKYLLSLLMAFAFLNCNAQKKVASYYNTFYEKSFDILATELEDPDEEITTFIEVAGDELEQKMFLVCEFTSVLIEDLKSIREQYAKYIDYATKHDIRGTSEFIPISLPKMSVAWNDSGWHFSNAESYQLKFMVSKEGKNRIGLMAKVNDKSNANYTATLHWAFDDLDDFDRVIKAVEEANLYDFMNKFNN